VHAGPHSSAAAKRKGRSLPETPRPMYAICTPRGGDGGEKTRADGPSVAPPCKVRTGGPDARVFFRPHSASSPTVGKYPHRFARARHWVDGAQHSTRPTSTTQEALEHTRSIHATVQNKIRGPARPQVVERATGAQFAVTKAPAATPPPPPSARAMVRPLSQYCNTRGVPQSHCA
jgi:hypothetical protein